MPLCSNFAEQVKADADIDRTIGEHFRFRKCRLWEERAHEQRHGDGRQQKE